MSRAAVNPDKAFSQLDDEAEYKYLLLDSPMAEQLFAAHYLDIELEPFQVFSIRLLRGRFSNEQEIHHFIADNEMEWMYENGWLRHGGNPGISPHYWKKPNVLVLWPAGHGKTTVVTTKVMPAMEMCDNPNSRTQYIGKSDKESDKFSIAQRHVLMQPNLVKDFGTFKPEDKAIPWANYAYSVAQRQHADVSENAEFYGTHSDAALGRRSDRVLIDDIETPDTARTPEQREKLLEWCHTGPFTSPFPIWTRDEHGQVRIPARLKWSKTARYWGVGVVGTIFHPEALYAMIMRDPTFTCVKFDCFKDKKCSVALSEKMMSVEDLEAKRLSVNTLVFNKRFRNIAYNEEEMAFRESWLRGLEEVIAGQRITHPGCLDRERSFGQFEPEWDIYCGFDPASGSRTRWSAHSAYVLLGRDRKGEDENIYLIDYKKLQDNFDRMLDWLLDGNDDYAIRGFFRQYGYKRATVEKNAFGTWLINNDRIQPWIRKGIIHPHTTGSNKSDPVAGVFSIGEMMQNGRFRIPYKEPSDQAKAEEFIAELLIFPKSTGDLVMAMWLAQYPISTMKNELRSWFTRGGKGKLIAVPSWQG